MQHGPTVFMLAVAASVCSACGRARCLLPSVKPESAKTRRSSSWPSSRQRASPVWDERHEVALRRQASPTRPEPGFRAAPRPGRLFSCSGRRRPEAAGNVRAYHVRQTRPPSGVPGHGEDRRRRENTGTPSSSGTLDLGPRQHAAGLGAGQGSGSDRRGPGTGNAAPVGVITFRRRSHPHPTASRLSERVRVMVCSVSGELPGSTAKRLSPGLSRQAGSRGGSAPCARRRNRNRSPSRRTHPHTPRW